MQKEDLIKRMRLVVTLTTLAFVFLVVVLLIQFGFIANYHTKIKDLQDRNANIQQDLDNLQKELDYLNGEYGTDHGATH